MVVLWQDSAKEDLRKIFNYYKYELLTEQTAISIWNDLVDESERLSQFAQIGQIEPALADLPIEYRYLLVRRIYKLIYFVDKDMVHIVAVWNCKNRPSLLPKKISYSIDI